MDKGKISTSKFGQVLKLLLIKMENQTKKLHFMKYQEICEYVINGSLITGNHSSVVYNP